MASPEEPKGEQSPGGGDLPPSHYYDESYTYDSSSAASFATGETSQPVVPPLPPPPAPLTPTVHSSSSSSGSTRKPPPPPPPPDPKEEEEDSMLRMSFMGHLEELRKRIFLMLIGVVIAFAVSLTFCNQLWNIVRQPAAAALTSLGAKPDLVAITPMETFNVVWFKLPTLVAIFLSSPWILYQVWAFISPGLYKHERRLAAPFVISSAGLFVMGGLFAYFVAFRFGLTFLLGIAVGEGIQNMISVNEYFDMFVNVTLGIGIVFELPVLVFLLTLLRIVTPSFLIRNSRYAILGIVVLAAVITPTPDIFNLMLFATPMLLLFYVGILASWLLVLRREKRVLPWKKIGFISFLIILLLCFLGYAAISHYHLHYIGKWPFLSR